MQRLKSHVCGEWFEGAGAPSELLNPATGEILATTSTEGMDLAAVLEHARTVGGPTLRDMTFAQRGALLQAMSTILHAHREDLIALAIANGGNTRKDAKFDIDGAWQTLAYYAHLGKTLGDKRYLVDGDIEQLGRNPRWAGEHIHTPLEGVAVHINAYNFPAWGFAEKAATALLAGMPVVTKPATSTALVAARAMELFVEADVFPAGTFSMICGGAHALLDHVGPQDVVAFTGGSATARRMREGGRVVQDNVRLNIEADSLNAAVLGPDVDTDSEVYVLFIDHVFTEMTQKTGQKCTAIRRILVPESLLEPVKEDLLERINELVVGDPSLENVRMGPLVSASQHASVLAGLTALEEDADRVEGIAPKSLEGIEEGKGYFVTPVLLQARDSLNAGAVNRVEVFGPVSTLLPWSGDPDEASAILRAGGGGLVASIYSDDRAFTSAVVRGSASHFGRLFLAHSKVAGMVTAPGTVLPQMVHGGPGRAGGGEELGGIRGLTHYMARTALQGYRPILERDFDGS
jgi:oxepin-CoA hydrolase/3-oxo-5,6-dehydrosuberyl-CoA semialdehyde dehydrogenase